jgi:hypothetical protein
VGAAHLRRWTAEALVAAYREYASLGLAPSAMHLDRFEQPAEKLKTAHEAYFQYA